MLYIEMDCFTLWINWAELAVCDVRGDSPGVSIIRSPPQIGGDMLYLFSILEELLLVKRYLVYEKTVEFWVYWLDLSGPRWENKLGRPDDVLGVNSWLALSASHFPVWRGMPFEYFEVSQAFDEVSGMKDILNLMDNQMNRMNRFLLLYPISQKWTSSKVVSPTPSPMLLPTSEAHAVGACMWFWSPGWDPGVLQRWEWCKFG